MFKLQMDKRTVVIISVYAPQQGLINDEEDCFSERLYN